MSVQTASIMARTGPGNRPRVRGDDVWQSVDEWLVDGPMTILCPTYWYPEHATDVHATYVHDINRHLVARGHRVRVVTPGKPGTKSRETFDGVEVVRFSCNLPEDLSYGKVAQGGADTRQRINRVVAMGRYLYAQYRQVVREGRGIKPDLVHVHWAIPSGPAGVAAALRLQVPSVITLHGGDVYMNKEQGYDFPTRWYVKPILRWTLRQATALTAITDDCRQHALRAGAPDGTLSVIVNGADLKRFSPARGGEPGVYYGPRMVFACRQLFPRKGIRFLVQALALIKHRYPDARLVIAGDGFERPALEHLAAELGVAERTTFLGWVPNVELPKYYRAAAVTVLPSLEEGFGIPAAEAMGCGVAVIASDAGGLPEVVKDGVTGRVVPKGNAPALAEALAELLANADLRKRFGTAGRERALRLFSWDKTAEQFEALYRRVLQPSARDVLTTRESV
jgi:glycosyltransferase involved in cell wall biosynthesis